MKRLVRPLVGLVEVPWEGEEGWDLYSTYYHKKNSNDSNGDGSNGSNGSNGTSNGHSGAEGVPQAGRAFLPRAASQIDSDDALSTGHLVDTMHS